MVKLGRAFVLIVLLVVHWAAAPPQAAAGEYTCALFPIAVYPNGTLYYAEYFEPNCDAESTPNYLFGDYPWPWQICPDDCGELFAAGAAEAQPSVAQGFEGLPEKVSFDYMHRHSAGGRSNELAGRKPGQSCFPGGPARQCCRVNQELNRLILQFQVNGDARYAKVLQLEVNVEKASLTPDQHHWKTTYVAFEVPGKPPAGEGYEVVKAKNLADVRPANPYIKRAQFRKAPGQLAKALILLSK